MLGLKKALLLEFDLIILDINLPNLDGISVCKKVRAKKDIPIIMITAK